MNGRQALEALERVVEARRVALRDNYNFADRPPALPDDCVGISLADLRAALASKDAGPQKGGEIVDHCPHGKIRAPYCHKCAEAIAKANDMNVFPDMVAMGAEFTRLRAWEKWAREQAKPTLEHYAGRRQGFSSEAGDALADMPQDAGEPKP